MGDTDSVMIQSYYGNHGLLGKGRLLGSKVSTIFLYILPQTLKSNSPLRIKALTFHSFVVPWLLTIHLRMEKRSNFSFTVYACLCNPIWLLCALFIITIKVYRGDSDKAQDTIIGFYNEFYTVAMKSTILQFATEKVIAII